MISANDPESNRLVLLVAGTDLRLEGGIPLDIPAAYLKDVAHQPAHSPKLTLGDRETPILRIVRLTQMEYSVPLAACRPSQVPAHRQQEAHATRGLSRADKT